MGGLLGQQGNIPDHIKSVLNLFGSTALIRAAGRVPGNIWEMPIQELEARTKPSRAAMLLRNAILRATVNAVRGQKIHLTRLCKVAGLSYTHGYALINHPELFAWLLQPNDDLSIQTSILAQEALDQMREILNLPIADSRGRTIAKNAKLKLMAWQLLDARYGDRLLKQFPRF
jgi:hypothetical protein